MKTGIIHFIFFFILCGLLQAEVRIWTEKDGTQYEAEFVRELFNKVTLRDAQGNEHRIAVEDFSEHDRKYLRVKVPPVVDIEIRKIVEIKPKPIEVYDMDDNVNSLIRAEVHIKKKSRRIFTSRLRAELFFIAEELDGKNYILLGKSETSFLLGEHNDNMHEFTSDPVETVSYRDYNTDLRGSAYVGRVLAISDADGNVVQVDSDIKWLENKVEELRELYIRGAASVYSRHFDKETVQKTKVPRARYVKAPYL